MSRNALLAGCIALRDVMVVAKIQAKRLETAKSLSRSDDKVEVSIALEGKVSTAFANLFHLPRMVVAKLRNTKP